MYRIVVIALVCFLPLVACQRNDSFRIEEYPKSRVILLTDILNEADDSQTLVRLLMYSNVMDIEGLIAVSSCHQYNGKNDRDADRNTVHPNEIKKYILAYGEVRDNLLKHDKAWPTKEELLQVVGAGPDGFGTRDIGPGMSTSGSTIICKAITKDDDRPLYIIVNGGANCIAQALIDLTQQMSRFELDKLLVKVRICDNAGQDNAGAWIAHNFPKIHYKRSSNQVYNFMNDKGPVVWDSTFYAGKGQYLWTKEHVQNNHGALGSIYPTRMRWKDPNTFHTIEGGGSGNFIGFVNRGLYHPEHVNWGGWGGRFETEKIENIYGNQLKWAEPDLFDSELQYQPYFMYPEASDSWTDPETGIKYEGVGAPIFRWRYAYQNDFQARMDWCVKRVDEANHNPVAIVAGDKGDGIIYCKVSESNSIILNASQSFDPDSNHLSFNWFYYPEAGTYDGNIELAGSNSPVVQIGIPEHSSGKQIHIILEVKDNNPEVPLYDYRRVIIEII